MGLARIAIAVLAVVLACGLLVIGGMALWGALTGKDEKKSNAAPSQSGSAAASSTEAKPSASSGQVGNRITVRCLAAQCPVFVSGPANDVQFNGNLRQNETRIFEDTRLTVAVQDAGGVTVTINGHVQPQGRHGEAKTYEAPTGQ
ncbi:hypothetical protein [Actinoallomurus iriomotensis]|uniref:DUF4115 domain-containing protein n=1 Tax=Actinoallomurus iriomotensis TaxID=478107 RepID=A0A9W6W6A9_9ACTN|nr:hypothetical protein [Actinoallomurus iriomotensis]GLY90861.1 hypothetical protein Airi02_087900 [Actinoallomurus iriomotensis]